MGRWDELDKKRYSQRGTGPGEFGPDYSDRKKYQLGYGNESPSPILKEYLNSVGKYPTHVIEPYNVEETKMACDNIDCSCEGCTCDPCECTIDNPCGCDEDITVQRKSRPTGRITNEWKGLI